MPSADCICSLHQTTSKITMAQKITSYADIPSDTPLEDIPGKVATVVNGFHSHKTVPLRYRKEQLRNLYYAIYDNTDLFYEAIFKDLHRPKLETDLSEIGFLLKEIAYFIDNLEDFAKPESVKLDIIMRPATAHIYKQPYGTVLIIAPWNYPFLLSLSPLAAAIAAGNTVVLKLSELNTETSRALAKVLQTYLDPDVVTTVTGAIPQSTALLKEKFDKIIYTGNGAVGKVVSRAAAEHLTPVLLELGGKSPVIITKSADLRLAARRILWGKQMNAGQTCVAPDYILVDASVKAQFIKELRSVYNEYFPTSTTGSFDSYAHIINERHFGRLKDVLDNTSGNVVLGGDIDEDTKLISPTIVDNISASDSLMKDELFGPLIGIISVNSVDEAIEFIRKEHDTPLALYIFSNNKAEQQKILNYTRSGGVGINDPLMHVNILNAPFGGVGQSGTGGGYHGKYGFEAFSHSRTVFHQSSIIERLLFIRYPPYTEFKRSKYHDLAVQKPWFPRSGPVQKSILRLALTSKRFWVVILLAILTAKYRLAK